LLKKHKGTPLEPELWFRLAELHMRRSKTERFFEIHRQSETVVSLVPRVVKQASFRKAILEAVNTYELIQRKFPKFGRIDLVMFNNAFARQNIGQSKAAEALYWKLIQQHPNSPLIPDSHLSIGELNFERHNFKHALEHFLAIENYPNARVYPYGLYKAGWTYYNLRQGENALKKLEQVVEFGHMVSQKGLEARLDLRREALADMTLFFGEVYPADKAFAYFEKQARELPVEPLLLRLSKLYERHSRWNDREVILKTVLAKRPTSPLVPEIHNELVWNYEQMKSKPQAVAQMQAFSQVCDRAKFDSKFNDNSVDAPERAPTTKESCMALLHDTSLKLASRWLKTWKRNKAYGEFADAAEQAFQIYLKDNDSKEATEARFAYAEFLFQRQKFRQASIEYAQVSRSGASKQISHDAGYAALLSLEKAVGDKWSDADVTSFHELASAYVTQNPKGEYILDVEFKLGMLAYEKGKYDEAGPIFLRLGETFPKDEKGLKAQDLYLDILNLKKDYKGLTEYSAGLIAKGVKSDRKEKLSGIYRQAYFLQIQAMEEKGDYKQALTEYRKFSDENQKSDLAEKALWNSFQLHFKVGDLAGGAETGLLFYKRYPKSKDAKDGLLKSAKTFEDLGQLDQAADALTALVRLDPKEAVK
ncbi:MAG: tetratricopeptide repeat protein, partial [Bdellovibrionales bacterium]|nr:tetratricopeptide repeat protein [Bdellovibrionales bacterium]